MASNFSVIPIRWLLTVDSEMAFFLFHSLAEGVLGLKLTRLKKNLFAKLVNCKSKFHSKNQYRTHCFVIHAISVFSVKFTGVEFTS